MNISEVRIKLVEKSAERLRAFCSITLDGDFVIRDLKIIDGVNGAFVAMPSRKLADRCPRCGCKNHLRAKFCNDCGQRLNENRAPKDPQGRSKLHADVAHPINAACRERIQGAVIKAFHEELERAKSPDYKPAKFDDFDDYEDFHHEEPHARPAPAAPAAPAAPTPAAAAPGAAAPQEPDEFGDYNALIAELKRDAAGRREKREESRRSPSRTPAVDDEEGDDREPVAHEPPAAPKATRTPPTREGAKPASPQAREPDDFGSGL